MVTLTVPVTTFGATASREAQARLREQAAAQVQARAVRDARQQYRAARTVAFGALARIRTSQERADLAEQSLNLMLERYRDGKATLTELVDVQSAYADARVAHLQALADYNAARLRLEREPERLASAGGVLPPEAPPATCAATSAPEIAGLRLGMAEADVRRVLPGLPALETVDVPAWPPSSRATHASLRFRDGRLVSILLRFSPEAALRDGDDAGGEHSLHAFLGTVVRDFGLPGPWRAFYDWRDKTLADADELRDLAAECNGFRLRVGLGLLSEGRRRVIEPRLRLELTPH